MLTIHSPTSVQMLFGGLIGNAKISLQEKHQGNHPPEQLVFLARQLLEARQGTLRELKNPVGAGSKMEESKINCLVQGLKLYSKSWLRFTHAILF